MNLNQISWFFCALLLAATLSCRHQLSEPLAGVIAENGMVSSAHPLASKVGIDILKAGGNAFDAAVAVHFALAVVHPSAGNIGGGGFLVYRQADGNTGALDFREMAPMLAHRDMYLDENNQVISDLSTIGHLSAGVPGSVDGMFQIQEKLCTMPMKNLIEPAIQLALNGVVLTEQEAAGLNYNREDFIETNNYTPYLVRDAPWMAGDTLFHSQLAQTLSRIRDKGRDGFYRGITAQLIVEEMQAGNGK